LVLKRVSPHCSISQKKLAFTLQRLAILVLSCGIIIIAAGCSEIRMGPTAPVASQVQVNISPRSVVLSPGAQQRFSATVQGTSNSAVTWTASAGSIAGDGTFIAPSTKSAIQITVTATCVADSTQHASSTVSVQLPPQLEITTSYISGLVANTPYSAALQGSGGTPPYRWAISAGSLPAGIQLQGSTGSLTGTPTQPGTFSFTAKLTDAASNSATQNLSATVSAAANSAYDGPAELPRVYLKTTLADTPAPGSTITVAANGNLQDALNSANCGDTIELQAGATYSGGLYTLPAKACDSQHWIIIRTSAPDSALPPEGTRMTPCYAGVASLTGRPSFGCTSPQKVLATISYSGTGDGPLVFANGANHYRLLGLEVTRTANNKTPVGALIAAETQSSMDSIVIDRLYVHGTPTDETRRGVRLSGATNAAVQDSYFSDFHCNVSGTCIDSQAISGGTGDLPMGPYKITNNFLEAAGENVLFGGGEATQIPVDIEVTRNHFFKPMFWLKGQPGFIVDVIVKNHFELKNAQRVLVDSNIMENNWGGFSQFGFSVVLTPKNQDLDGQSVCPLCRVTDVTVRYATISHVAGAFIVANVITPVGGVPFAGQNFSIHDVIADDMDGTKYQGHGTLAEVSTVAQPLLQNVDINHITAFPNQTMLNIGGPNTVKMPGFIFANSIVAAAQTPVWSTGAGGSSNCAYYDVPVKTMGLCFSGYDFSHNAILGSPYSQSSWPAGNFFYSSATIGFVNYNNGNGGDYHLLPSSPAIGAASDGTNLGANVDAVLNAIAGVQ